MPLLRLASHPTDGDQFLYYISPDLPQAYAQRVSKTPSGESLYQVHLDYEQGYSHDLPGLYRLLGGTLLEYHHLDSSAAQHIIGLPHGTEQTVDDEAAQAAVDQALDLGDANALERDLEVIQDNAYHFGHDHAVAICELDGFDSFSAVHGHQAATEALNAVAYTISEQCRIGDSVYHPHGGVFVVIFPGERPETATIALERIRRAIEALGLPSAGSDTGRLTVSAGVAGIQPHERSAAWDDARAALRSAERAGGNRICGAPALAVAN